MNTHTTKVDVVLMYYSFRGSGMSSSCSQGGEQRLNLGQQQSASENGNVPSVLVGNTSFSSFELFQYIFN